MSGLSKPFLYDLESGRTNPTLSSLVKLARAYQISVRDILEPAFNASQPVALCPGAEALQQQVGVMEEYEIALEELTDLSRIVYKSRRLTTWQEALETLLLLRRVCRKG